MMKSIVVTAAAVFMAMSAGSASSETMVIVNGQNGVYVSGPDGDLRRSHRWNDDDRGGWRGHQNPPRIEVRPRDRNDDYAAGIMGFLGGMAVGSALDNGGRIPVIRHPEGRYRPRPAIVSPWSPNWYRWCEARYRSFDPRSGTFIDRDGRERFCEVVPGRY